MIALILTIALCGFAVWVVLQLPMPQVFKNLIIGVVTLALVIWVLQQLGFNTGVPTIHWR